MIYDVCVIGGGPAGMFSAYYSASRRLNTVLIEGDHELGGRLNLFLDYAIYDLPGQFGILAHDYKNGLVEQLTLSKAEIILGQIVMSVEKNEGLFHVMTNCQKFVAKTIILATGNGYSEVKKLDDSIISKEINYNTPKIKQYNGDIAIIGHTPMAADWAIQLKRAGNCVTLYTDEKLKLQPILMDQLDEYQITIHPLSCFDEEQYSLIYCHIGTTKRTIEHATRILQLDNGLTDVVGCFVAGDARYEQGKLKLIHGATHDAMQAVNSAFQYLHKDAYYQPIVSTHEPIFKEWEK